MIYATLSNPLWEKILRQFQGPRPISSLNLFNHGCSYPYGAWYQSKKGEDNEFLLYLLKTAKQSHEAAEVIGLELDFLQNVKSDGLWDLYYKRHIMEKMPQIGRAHV